MDQALLKALESFAWAMRHSLSSRTNKLLAAKVPPTNSSSHSTSATSP